MTAPMPRAVSEMGPSDFFNACSAHSESLISLSMDLRAKSCDRGAAPAEGSGQREHASRMTLP
jgi:hypothetical protein